MTVIERKKDSLRSLPFPLKIAPLQAENSIMTQGRQTFNYIEILWNACNSLHFKSFQLKKFYISPKFTAARFRKFAAYLVFSAMKMQVMKILSGLAEI